MKLDEIRQRYLDFFQQRGHTVCPSDSLVPANDPSLLFTGAGMNQFKDMFLGRGSHSFKRATSSQKCLRTGDLDNVGRTSGHHTFFEMLGNFSFGDYFKKEAIAWAWEFLTKEMNIPADRLFVSVYKDDDEAFGIWEKSVGIPAKRIFRLGEHDNFWPADAPSQGPNGPCGPCSEIYYDFGAEHGCGKASCDVTCDCNRHVEIWNLVFTQFDRQEDGSLPPLPQKNIDTGAGLERFAAVIQGVHSNFDTDVFKSIIEAERSILKVSGADADQARRLRRIADHVRALVFCIADNAMPGNTGRNYVVRRLLRTALRDGVQLGRREAFLHRIIPAILDVMKGAYPHLVEQREKIGQIVKTEEEKFLATLETGTEILEELISKLRRDGKDTLGGEDAFRLYDTHGFPIEMTEEILRERRLKVDRAAVERISEEHRERNRDEKDIFEKGAFAEIKDQKTPVSEFLGYGIPVATLSESHPATVQKVIRIGSRKDYDASKRDLVAFTRLLNAQDSRLVESAGEGDSVAVLLDRTPFYAESGGQVGDAGTIVGDATVNVEDCKKPDGYFIHLGRVAKGTLKVGSKVKASIDAPRRLDVMRNHTGTHVLQAALRAVLGPHVQQAGSVVHPDRLRFDFSHFQAVTPEEIRKIEDWVNGVVFDDHEVTKVEMSMEEASAKGAIAFFGEKYGDHVRVVTVGPSLSVELCGGTHLEHSATIGSFRVTGESSIGSGIRRIEAATGPRVVELARADDAHLLELSKLLKSPKPDLRRKVQRLIDDLSRARTRAGQAAVPAGEFPSKEVNGEKIVAQHVPDADVNELRKIMDQLIKKQKVAAAILAGGGEKPAFVIGVREDLVKSKGLHAGQLAKEIGKACGGGGGGREVQAQAGAGDASKIPLGLKTFEELVSSLLGS